MVVNNKLFIIIVAILLLSIVGVWVYNGYLKDMPQVSKKETVSLLENYKENINILYNELNSKYNGMKDRWNNKDEWEAFSKDWVPRVVQARPKTLDKRLPENYTNDKILLMSAHNNLLPLWQEYNNYFAGEKVNTEKIEQLKEQTEEILEKVEL